MILILPAKIKSFLQSKMGLLQKIFPPLSEAKTHSQRGSKILVGQIEKRQKHLAPQTEKFQSSIFQGLTKTTFLKDSLGKEIFQRLACIDRE